VDLGRTRAGVTFGIHTLPYGVFSTAPDGRDRRVGVAYRDDVLDLAALAERLRLPADLFATGSLNPLLAQGPAVWREVRARLIDWLTGPGSRSHRIPRAGVRMHLPFTVADYVDFYSSPHHASNVGRILRPDDEPLLPNWKHLPVGYHGRAGTVVVSGTPIVRPHGQRRSRTGSPAFGPTRRLDIEAEVGFVVGVPSTLGQPVPLAGFEQHVFGACLVNDWSARDIQAWEYQPLGPFLGKSFVTSVSPWVVGLEALREARIAPPARDPAPLPYLRDDTDSWGLDITLEIRLNGHLVSRPPFAAMYWTPAQQLAHMTVNGASLRTGDLYASGTVSGPAPDQYGSLLELTWGGRDPLVLPGGEQRTFLEDGDEVVISATAPGPDGEPIDFGEVRGRVEES
jgi:fumarylacetoacetase